MARRFLVSIGLISTLLALAGAQQPPAPSAETGQQPTFRAEANYVRVDVYPTLDGRPVTDLTAADFEVFEDGRPQSITNFEFIRIAAGGTQAVPHEPNTVAESREMAADARSRVFVLFLDTYHVEDEASRNVRQPLVNLLDRIIGPDDLIGVMTPEMSASNLTLARKTGSIESILSSAWGRRTDLTKRDPEEERYEQCYPEGYVPACPGEMDEGIPFKGIAHEMILRRREKLTLDALEDLVRYLRTVREERKAVLTVTDGWTLYQANQRLGMKLKCQPVPGTPGIGVGQGGQLTMGDRRNPDGGSAYQCDSDRMMLSQLDNEQQFRDILQEANQSNASFYPIDPRGLPAFDTPIGPDRPLPPAADAAQLSNRISTLRTLASATDGIAIVNSNDIESGLRRVADDLSSYYLLGYYSTNTKLDGKYRTIDVRVKRPGVNVRARRGYRAALRDRAERRQAGP